MSRGPRGRGTGERKVRGERVRGERVPRGGELVKKIYESCEQSRTAFNRTATVLRSTREYIYSCWGQGKRSPCSNSMVFAARRPAQCTVRYRRHGPQSSARLLGSGEGSTSFSCKIQSFQDRKRTKLREVASRMPGPLTSGSPLARHRTPKCTKVRSTSASGSRAVVKGVLQQQ